MSEEGKFSRFYLLVGVLTFILRWKVYTRRENLCCVEGENNLCRVKGENKKCNLTLKRAHLPVTWLSDLTPELQLAIAIMLSF